MQRKILLAGVALSVILGANGFAGAQSSTDTDQTGHRSDQTTTPTQQKPPAQTNGTSAQPSTASGQQSQPSQAPNQTQSSQAPAGAPAQDQNAQSQTSPAQSQPSSAQNNQSSPAQQNRAAAPQNNQPASAQNNQPTSGQNNQPASAQSNTPNAAPRNAAQQPAPATANQNQPTTAQQPNPSNNQAATPSANNRAAAQTGSDNVRVSASLQTEQRTRLNSAVASVSVKPITNVNFSVSVGTAVPRNVSLRPLPTSIVTVIPQYRGYSFFAVRDEIVVVEPRTYKIVDIIDRRGGGARAQAPASSIKPLNLTSQQKDIIRKGSASRTTATTGSATRTQTITVGQELPDTVVIEDVPETVYREVPAVRSYRYYNSGSGMYLVEPGTRRVIEEID
jgi:hypothetical protein